MEYNEKIRYAIKKSGTTAGKVAEHIGVSQPMISKVINGRAEFSSENLVKLANFLKVPVDFFIKDNYISLESIKLEGKIKSILEDSNSVDYMVVMSDAKKASISPAELSQAINFILDLKKKAGSN